MIDNFNQKYFTKGYLPPEPYTTSSKNFNEEAMLDDSISMVDGMIYIFVAPDGGEECTYEWKAMIPVKNSDGRDVFSERVLGVAKELKYQAPKPFNVDKENRLVVTVTEASGRKFTDTAKVYITSE